MREVSQFEANLIRVLRCIVSGSSPDGVLEIVRRESSRPKCLSRDCVELAKDALRKGVPRRFAKLGWKRERFLQGDAEKVAEGRLWQRWDGESRQLNFSGAVLEWLIWITAEPLPESNKKCRVALEDCPLGDQLFLLLAFETFCDSPASKAVCGQPVFRAHPLVPLCFPLAALRTKMEPASGLNFWFELDRAWVLEALQGKIHERWLRFERARAGETQWQTVQKMGELQQRVLDDCLSAAESTRRWDLVRFVMTTAVASLSEIDFHRAASELDLTGLKLSQQQEVREASLTLLRSLNRLARRQEQARTIGFYDDGYDASQLWKSDWERWNGDAVCRQARDIVQSLAALAST